MTTNLERASIVSRRVQLRDVDLVGAQFKSTLGPFQPPEPMGLEVGFASAFTTVVEDDDDSSQHIVVVVKVKVEAQPLSDSSAGEDEVADATLDPFLTVHLSLRLTYRLLEGRAEDLPRDALTHFASLNGTYNAWPYVRELVQNLTARTTIGGLVIPLFRPEEQRAEPAAGPSEADAPADAARSAAVRQTTS